MSCLGKKEKKTSIILPHSPHLYRVNCIKVHDIQIFEISRVENTQNPIKTEKVSCVEYLLLTVLFALDAIYSSYISGILHLFIFWKNEN